MLRVEEDDDPEPVEVDVLRGVAGALSCLAVVLAAARAALLVVGAVWAESG